MINAKGSLTGVVSLKGSIKGSLNNAVKYVEPTTQEKTVTPNREQQIIVPDEGVFALSKVTVDGSPDLLSENIREGKEIFGVQGTAQTVGYEWADYDPINIIELLDNDKEEYEAKVIILLTNKGTNEYSFDYDRFPLYKGDVVKFSDGGELTISGTHTYTFDESKDFENSLGQMLRYMIIYKKSGQCNTSAFSGKDDVLMYYFKNCQFANGGNRFKGESIVTALFDENTVITVTSYNWATVSNCMVEFKIPKLVVPDNKKTIQYSFTDSMSLKKISFNLENVINNISQACSGCYNLEEMYLENCPTDVAVNCTDFLKNCYGLRKLIAKPMLKCQSTSSTFGSLRQLQILDGFDFEEHTGQIYLRDVYSLTTVKNIKNINTTTNLMNANNLTHQSLLNIFNALVDLTGQGTKTLTIGTTNQKKVSDEEKAIAINKNWTLS